MRHDQRPEVGTKVYLRPTRPDAPLECYRFLEVEVHGYERWPLVAVWVGTSPETKLMHIHADNIGLHPSKNKARGDQANGQQVEHKPRVLPGKKLPPDLPDGWEEQTLW